jgi:hypothetical protein
MLGTIRIQHHVFSGNQTWQWKIHQLMDAFPNTIYPGFPIAMFDDQTRVSHVFKQTINSHGFTVFHFQ